MQREEHGFEGEKDMQGCSSSSRLSCGVLASKARSAVTAVSSSSRVVLLLLVLLLAAAFSVRWIDSSFLLGTTTTLPFTCPANWTATCSTTTNTTTTTTTNATFPPPTTCPDYFHYIYEDLRPWNTTGITRDAVESAKKDAAFRFVVVDGRPYIEHYHSVFQTRDVFTIWGILQLLRHYPGRVPDLDLMFNCEDMPVVRADEYRRPNAPVPRPLFRYCKDDTTIDIVFPDWSFWGWPEINIKPWEVLMREMIKGNKRVKWANREPYAYWRGNQWVSQPRQDLMKCNVSKDHEWNARLYGQDWGKEIKQGFKESDLANQCHHKYKIYIEGRAWSVSEKYIFACDSPALVVTSRYHDFFNRGLMPRRHYWPIRDVDKCRSIKFAVDWGNSHSNEAKDIGKEGSNLILEQVNMEYVYDYMLHLLSEYAKLLKYKPTVPEKAVELCLESMVCQRVGREKEFMIESMVRAPHDSAPCTMPPPFSSAELTELLAIKKNSTEKVEMLEKEAWKH